MEKVTFGGNLTGYVHGPKSGPALIVLQEWFGVNEAIQELAILVSDRIGVRVMIPDLYHGKVGVDAEEASHLMNTLDWKLAVTEMGEAVKYLRDAGAPKVGAIGFCMGGALCFAAAQHCGVDCATPFYGTPNPAICDVAAIKVPIQAHFGALDAFKGFADPETAREVERKINEAGGNVEVIVHDGCGHGYMNALTPEGKKKIEMMKFPVAPQAELDASLASITSFFKKYLF